MGHNLFSSVMDAGAWLVTMATPSSGREITAARVLAQMAQAVAASLLEAVTRILLLYSLLVFVNRDILVSHVRT